MDGQRRMVTENQNVSGIKLFLYHLIEVPHMKDTELSLKDYSFVGHSTIQSRGSRLMFQRCILLPHHPDDGGSMHL
jgi:hypothetical protein